MEENQWLEEKNEKLGKRLRQVYMIYCNDCRENIFKNQSLGETLQNKHSVCYFLL